MDIRKYYKIGMCLLVMLGACKDADVESPELHLEGVQQLRATSQTEGVVLSWENPTNREYDRVEISYTQEGQEKTINEEVNEQFHIVEIELPNTDVYKFFVRAYSSRTQKSAMLESVKGRKLASLVPEDELGELLNSVQVSGGDGGVRVIWENPRNIQATIRLAFGGQSHDINANSMLKEYTLGGLDLNNVYSMEATIVYDGEVSTSGKTFLVTALPAYRKLINDDWAITASSTQSGLSAASLLDDNPNTYWRSDVRISAAHQYVIVDFRRLRYISALTFVRKWGDNENSSWDINISTSEDGTTYTVPYTYHNTNSDPQFALEFNRTVDGEQIYMLPHTHSARYVRIDFVRGNGFAIFGDINFYGQ